MKWLWKPEWLCIFVNCEWICVQESEHISKCKDKLSNFYIKMIEGGCLKTMSWEKTCELDFKYKICCSPK